MAAATLPGKFSKFGPRVVHNNSSSGTRRPAHKGALARGREGRGTRREGKCEVAHAPARGGEGIGGRRKRRGRGRRKGRGSGRRKERRIGRRKSSR